MSQLDDEKLFYERFWALHRDTVMLSILNEFGIGVFRRSSVLEGFDDFLQEAGFSGRKCVEIGTCNGLTAIVLSRYFKNVVTIDVAPNDLKVAIASHAGVRNIMFYDVRNNAEKSAVIKAIDFDAAFSDGDHARDTETDFALVERCGQVLFHEHWEAQPSVMGLVSRLRAAGGKIRTKGKWAIWTR